MTSDGSWTVTVTSLSLACPLFVTVRLYLTEQEEGQSWWVGGDAGTAQQGYAITGVVGWERILDPANSTASHRMVSSTLAKLSCDSSRKYPVMSAGEQRSVGDGFRAEVAPRSGNRLRRSCRPGQSSRVDYRESRYST